MGERTPHLDPHARAALLGLTASHTRAHVVRAILEGVAFSLRDTFYKFFGEMQVPARSIRLGGGGRSFPPSGARFRLTFYGHEVEIFASRRRGCFWSCDSGGRRGQGLAFGG